MTMGTTAGVRTLVPVAAALFVAAAFAGTAAAQTSPVMAEFFARVDSVVDGQTITVVRAGDVKRFRVRLWGVAAAPSPDSFGVLARIRLTGLVFGKVVRIRTQSIDRSRGTLIAQVFLDDFDVPSNPFNKRLMNGVLVGEGLARWDQRTAPGSTTLRNL
ncbi:MAG: thermonuclease family protein, partial [Planctomycetia bacterium]